MSNFRRQIVLSKEQINFFASPTAPVLHQVEAKKSGDTTATATPMVELSNFAGDGSSNSQSNIDEINPKKTANFGAHLQQSINQELKLVDGVRQSKHFKNISQDNQDCAH